MGTGRLLIVAGVTAASAEALPDSVRELIAQASEVLLVAPILTSELHLWTNDTDRAREQADQRLASLLAGVETVDPQVRAMGAVGDEIPLNAFDDAVRVFSPDHILIALRTGEQAAWQERDLVPQVKQKFGLPVTVIAVDEDGRVSSPRDA
jgi:hypothetical protein